MLKTTTNKIFRIRENKIRDNIWCADQIVHKLFGPIVYIPLSKSIEIACLIPPFHSHGFIISINDRSYCSPFDWNDLGSDPSKETYLEKKYLKGINRLFSADAI